MRTTLLPVVVSAVLYLAHVGVVATPAPSTEPALQAAEAVASSPNSGLDATLNSRNV